MSSDLDHLLNHIPPAWHGLFQVLQAKGKQLKEAESWYNDHAFSRSGSQPDWAGLLFGLAVDEPIAGGESLQFVPKFLHFPCDTRQHLLSFLLQQRHSIPTDDLNNFLTKIQPYMEDDDETWSEVLLKMLTTYVLSRKISNADLMTGHQYTFTSSNREDAEAICQELKNRQQILPFQYPVISKQSGENIPTSTFEMMDTDESKTGGAVSMEVQETINTDMNDFGNLVTKHKAESNIDNPDLILIEDSEDFVVDDDVTGLKLPEKIVGTESQFETSVSGPGLLVDHTICTPQLDDDNVNFSQNMMEKIDKLKELWQSGSGTNAPAEIDIFLNSSQDEVKVICQMLALSEMSESCLLNACQSLVTLSDVLSHGNCVEFLSAGLLPKISELMQNASRNLTGIILLVAEKFSKPFIDSIVVHCVKRKISNHQTDLICKVTREAFGNSDKVYLMMQIIASTGTLDENIVSIFQTIIDTKIELEEKDLEEMLYFCSSCQGLEKSTKFGKLILAIINRYGKQMTKKHAEMITRIIHDHSTFMKKSLETSLKKLKLL